MSRTFEVVELLRSVLLNLEGVDLRESAFAVGLVAFDGDVEDKGLVGSC